MNISNLSSLVPTVASAPGVQTSITNAPDRDGDGDGDGHGHGRVRKPHGGGNMHRALVQALEDIGLTVPQGNRRSGSPVSTTTGDAASTSGASPAAGNIKHDLHQFMHALFQAVKSENSAAPSKTDSASGDPKSSFAAGLSSLISQVSNGSAPAALQDAYAHLAADLQGSAPPPAPVDVSTAVASNSSTPPTLQALLTQLQQDLGYGKSSTSAIGNAVSAQA